VKILSMKRGPSGPWFAADLFTMKIHDKTLFLQRGIEVEVERDGGTVERRVAEIKQKTEEAQKLKQLIDPDGKITESLTFLKVFYRERHLAPLPKLKHLMELYKLYDRIAAMMHNPDIDVSVSLNALSWIVKGTREKEGYLKWEYLKKLTDSKLSSIKNISLAGIFLGVVTAGSSYILTAYDVFTAPQFLMGFFGGVVIGLAFFFYNMLSQQMANQRMKSGVNRSMVDRDIENFIKSTK